MTTPKVLPTSMNFVCTRAHRLPLTEEDIQHLHVGYVGLACH